MNWVNVTCIRCGAWWTLTSSLTGIVPPHTCFYSVATIRTPDGRVIR